MKKIITIFLLVLSFCAKCQYRIPLCNYGHYSVAEFNDKFQLYKDGELIVEQLNSHEFLIRINEDRGLMFLNSDCINCYEENLTYEVRDFTCTNNLNFEIIPLNDSLRIVNNFKLSIDCYGQAIKSKIYPKEDSLSRGNVIYNKFEYGHSQSKILSNKSRKTFPITPALKYYQFFDLIIGLEYNLDRNGEIKSTVFNFHEFVNGNFISLTKRELLYMKSSQDFPFRDVHEFSKIITNYIWLNNKSFGIQLNFNWFLCSFKMNGRQIPQIEVIPNRLDSIQSIPFFSPAYILYYPDSSVLQISDSRISGSAKFDTLLIKNYFAEGIEPYIDMEIIVFTITTGKHIIIMHHNGYPEYGKFKIHTGLNPLDFFDLEVHKLDSIPRNIMVIKTSHNKN